MSLEEKAENLYLKYLELDIEPLKLIRGDFNA